MEFAAFLQQRRQGTNQFLAVPHARATLLLSSHIWWTEMIGYSLLKLGYNVLFAEPFYLLYTQDEHFANFEHVWAHWLAQVRTYRVAALIGGNATTLMPHPKTGEMFHDAAGIRLINYWWDEPRTKPPYACRGWSPEEYLAHLKNPRTLNVIWDLDVLEELAAFYGITNTVHAPLATVPEFWPQKNIPLAQRPLECCFLGNCHFVADYADTAPDRFVTWANAVVARKLANLDTPMTACVAAAGATPAPLAHDDPWCRAFWHWEVLNAVYMHRTRNVVVQAAAEHLRGKLALIGKGWEKLGLRANAEHAQANTGHIYASARAALNLFGGCVHGGMPLRPFDIAASYGLILTHYNRELPALFTPEECLSFRNTSEMLAHLERLRADPSAYDKVVTAGHARVWRDHSWEKRLGSLVSS